MVLFVKIVHFCLNFEALWKVSVLSCESSTTHKGTDFDIDRSSSLRQELPASVDKLS